MARKKAEEKGVALPDPDDVLRVMLNTPPRPHGAPTAAKPKPTPRAKKKPAK